MGRGYLFCAFILFKFIKVGEINELLFLLIFSFMIYTDWKYLIVQSQMYRDYQNKFNRTEIFIHWHVPKVI